MATPAPAGPRVLPTRPYKDFLTPSLHRRFTNAALVSLLLCWVEAVLMSKPSLFWSWFPISLTGIRTLLLFICCLCIFILRVAQVHIGRRTTKSDLDTFQQYAVSYNTLHAFAWYLISAWLFCEVYVFSTAQKANLAWVDPGRSYERPRLNERPVLFRCLFVCLALVRAVVHLYKDDDRVPVQRRNAELNTSQAGSDAAVGTPGISSLVRLRTALPAILQQALSLTIIVSLVGPFVYFVFMRRPAWSLAFTIGKTLFSLHKSSKPTGLTDLSTLMLRFLGSGFLLVLLWETSNHAFSIFASDEPLKKGLPLTSDPKDANGSLIAGLKAKRNVPRNMAFWELAIITSRFEDRRKTLYQDIDRRGGSTWVQILNQCLFEIQGISQRIQDFQRPSVPAAPQQPQPAQNLPRISRPLNEGNILSASPRPTSTLDAIAGGVGAVAKAFGQSPGAHPVGPRAQKMLEFGTSKVLTQEQQQHIRSGSLMQQANGYLLQLVQSPLGIPLRQSFSRRINTIVFGGPFSHADSIVNAVQAACKLAVCSLREDSLGQVQRDIPTIIRVLVVTIQNVQGLVQTLPPHWTDVEFRSREVKEVEELLDVLRVGLEQVLLSFGEYADALGLGRAELRAAKEAVKRGPEMEAKKR